MNEGKDTRGCLRSGAIWMMILMISHLGGACVSEEELLVEKTRQAATAADYANRAKIDFGNRAKIDFGNRANIDFGNQIAADFVADLLIEFATSSTGSSGSGSEIAFGDTVYLDELPPALADFLTDPDYAYVNGDRDEPIHWDGRHLTVGEVNQIVLRYLTGCGWRPQQWLDIVLDWTTSNGSGSGSADTLHLRGIMGFDDRFLTTDQNSYTMEHVLACLLLRSNTSGVANYLSVASANGGLGTLPPTAHDIDGDGDLDPATEQHGFTEESVFNFDEGSAWGLYTPATGSQPASMRTFACTGGGALSMPEVDPSERGRGLLAPPPESVWETDGHGNAFPPLGYTSRYGVTWMGYCSEQDLPPNIGLDGRDQQGRSYVACTLHEDGTRFDFDCRRDLDGAVSDSLDAINVHIASPEWRPCARTAGCGPG